MRPNSVSASAFPAKWRNSSTSFSKRSISFCRSLSFELAGNGAAPLVFSFGLIPAPFERRGCRKFPGLLPPIRAWFSRAAALAARPWNRPASTIRTRPGTAPGQRQPNPPAAVLPAPKAACLLLPLERELLGEADCLLSRPARGEQSFPEKRGVPGRRSYPEL